MASSGQNEGFAVVQEFVCQAITDSDTASESGDLAVSPEVPTGEERAAEGNTGGNGSAKDNAGPKRNET